MNPAPKQPLSRRASASMRSKNAKKPAGGTVLQRLIKTEQLSRALCEFARRVEHGRANGRPR